MDIQIYVLYQITFEYQKVKRDSKDNQGKSYKNTNKGNK